MAVLKCKMCGGDLTPAEDSTVCECEFCGTLQTIPTADNEKKINLFARANRLRFNNEFDKAAGVYETIISDFLEEAEAYWGLVLCKYGIEYVDDPVTGKKIPTCHRSSFESIFDDNNYELVMEYADAVSKRVYRDEAKKIEDLRKGIIEVSSNEQPYDIFICYKETDENGNRTLDSVIAQDIYNALTEKGYRVFFSRISLEDKLGTEYEPYIFAALHSAKVMLAVGTKYEYYDAVWVKNEWSRYLKLIAAGEKRVLIPVYKNLDAYDMPKEFARLQAQDMGKVGAMQDLLRGIDKILGKENKKKEEIRITDNGLSALNAQTQALLKRGNMALEDHDYTRANDFYEQVLNNDAECGAAYWGKVLCTFKVNKPAELAQKAFAKIKDNEQGTRITMPFDAVTLAREADPQHLFDEFTDQELDELLADLLPEKITYEDNLAYYQKASQIYTTAENFGKLLDNRDYERACRYKDVYVEKEIERSIEELGNLIALAITTEKTNAEAAKKKLDEQAERFKKEIADSLAKVTEEISGMKAEEEAAYQKELKRWESEYDLAVKNWEQSKTDYEESCIAAENKKTELEGKIRQLEKEKENLTGLFTGRKRKELDNNIAVLKKTIDEIRIPENPGDKPVRKPKPEKRAAMVQQGASLSSKELVCITISPVYKFGSYQYDSQKKPIRWKILERKQDRALLITEEAIDVKRYNENFEDTTWEKCTLRKWLNNEFYNTAFTELEKKQILSTNVTAEKNPDYDTSPGRDTQDKIFLLSISEVRKYFKSDNERKTKATPYAKQKGCSVKDSGICVWWLRSPGSSSKIAACVYDVGSVFTSGGLLVNIGDVALRPALWVKIK